MSYMLLDKMPTWEYHYYEIHSILSLKFLILFLMFLFRIISVSNGSLKNSNILYFFEKLSRIVNCIGTLLILLFKLID